jgi:hypothetical protein
LTAVAQVILSVLIVVLVAVVVFAAVEDNGSSSKPTDAHRSDVLARPTLGGTTSSHESAAPAFRVLHQGRLR